MSLINVNVPNLLNGVSQQADPLRFVTQGNEQINGMSSVTEGLSKRNGSKFLYKLSNSSYQNYNPKIHFINRDRNERYVVLMYGNIEKSNSAISDYGKIRIWDIDTGAQMPLEIRYEDRELIEQGLPIISWGTSANVSNPQFPYVSSDWDDGEPIWATQNYSSGRSNPVYYIGKNPQKNVKMFTVADSTFVLNTDRIVRTTTVDAVTFSNKTVTRVGTTATVNLGTGISNVNFQVGELFQIEGTTLIAGVSRVTGRPNGTSFTFDTIDSGPTTYSNTVTIKKGERLVPFDMPHTLKRQANGIFLLERNYWDARSAGSPVNNPNPSFVGKKINDIFMYRSRLGFLADENVILSENSSFYNFYRTEMSTLLDSDPIDVSTAHSKVSILKHAVPFSERLVLFSDESQFYMTAVDVLTPKTASIQQTTEFSVDQLAKPSIVGKNIFFPFSRGQFSGIMEYFVTQDTLEFNGTDVTAAIPAYLQGTIRKITASSNEQIVVVLTEDAPSTLYIYKYFTAEDQKIQSSWSKWEYPENENVKILDAEFIENELYLVVDNASEETTDFLDFYGEPNDNLVFSNRGIYLESLNIKELTNDVQNSDFIKLDKKFDESKVLSKTYNAQTDTTDFVLPITTTKNIGVTQRYKEPETVYSYDGTPNNDNFIVKKPFDNLFEYGLINRGTSVSLLQFQSFGQDTATRSVVSLSGRGSRNFYSSANSTQDVTNVSQVNGVFCNICAIPYFPSSYSNLYSIHWVVEKWVGGFLTDYLISRPYPDYTGFFFDISSADNPLFHTSGAVPAGIAYSTNLPASLPLYPWEVDTWYSNLSFVYTIYGQNPPGFGFQPDPFSKITDTDTFVRRGSELSSSVLAEVKAGKNYTVATQENSLTELDYPNTPQGRYWLNRTKVTINGNHLNTPLWFGIPYEFRYQFSNPQLRLGGGGNQRTAVSDGRFQVKNGSLTFNDTVAFNVEVTAPFRDKNVYKFSNYTLGRGDAVIDSLPVKSGAFRFPVLSRNDKELKVEIVNNTPFPSSFISMDWEAFYSARARRI